MGKSILGVIVGIVLGGVLIHFMEMIPHSIYGTVNMEEITSREEFREMIARFPVGNFLLIALGHFVGIFIGGLTAFFIAGKKIEPLYFPVSFFLLATILVNIMIPAPNWALVVDISSAVIGGLLAFLIARKWKD